MTRSKVLLISAAIILLGLFQVLNWQGRTERAAALAKASGMIALLSGVGIGLYGLSMKGKQ